MEIRIPELALVVMVGTSGSGKSTFARQHFLRTEIISSDYCRGLVADDENDQAATKDAFEVLQFIAAKRLAAGRLTVIDATNTQPEARKPLIELARRFHCLPVALVLDMPERICHERNQSRPDRNFGEHVIRRRDVFQKMCREDLVDGLVLEGEAVLREVENVIHSRRVDVVQPRETFALRRTAPEVDPDRHHISHTRDCRQPGAADDRKPSERRSTWRAGGGR